MNKVFPLLLFILILSASAPAVELPGITHYGLDLHFLIKENQVRATAILSIRNETDKSFDTLPLLLYRLFAVDQVSDSSGTSLHYKQNVVELSDEPSLQARQVVVALRNPLRPHESITIAVVYGGFMFGYPEVMQYVKDRIDETYSLLRPDALAFPIVAESNFTSILAASNTKFTYEITATVPMEYRVACGGDLTQSQKVSDSTRFIFHSKIPTWRIDIAVAKFKVLTDPAQKLSVYFLSEDSAGARRVLEASRDVIALYSQWFGRPRSYQGYTVIEIPDGWGSQASDYYFLQTSAAFKDSSRIGEVYHEIGHTWNVTASTELKRCRWFDEAFASFFESLAIRAFRGERAFVEDMEKSRARFVQWAKSDRQVFETPIAGYGEKELGRHSYTKGAWSLYVLYSVVGEEMFCSIIRTMMTEFDGRTINFKEFQSLCERISKRRLEMFFSEWIYGAESSRLLVDKVPIAEITKRY